MYSISRTCSIGWDHRNLFQSKKGLKKHNRTEDTSLQTSDKAHNAELQPHEKNTNVASKVESKSQKVKGGEVTRHSSDKKKETVAKGETAVQSEKSETKLGAGNVDQNERKGNSEDVGEHNVTPPIGPMNASVMEEVGEHNVGADIARKFGGDDGIVRGKIDRYLNGDFFCSFANGRKMKISADRITQNL